MASQTSYFEKFKYSLPWLARYPFVRAGDRLFRAGGEKKHLIFTIANHFEPAWKEGGMHDIKSQRCRMSEWHAMARSIGDAVRDVDGTKFRHTNFYPAEQYDRHILDEMAEMQSEGLGDVEIHLHHGIENPDTSENLRRTLVDFRDCLADEHKCLSRLDGKGDPMYAFVHGNLALANSAGGRFCGVDDEMQILQDTGCYADMTLPSAPGQTQVPMINKIYECTLPFDQPVPHRKGRPVQVRSTDPALPLIFTGPLVFNWTRRIKGIPFPRIDDGAMTNNQPMDMARFKRWVSSNIIVKEQPDWVFIKLHCHGFFDNDQSACIGEEAIRFFSEMGEHGDRSGEYKLYFATAREAFNIVMAALDGKKGSPGSYRNYRLKEIMG